MRIMEVLLASGRDQQAIARLQFAGAAGERVELQALEATIRHESLNLQAGVGFPIINMVVLLRVMVSFGSVTRVLATRRDGLLAGPLRRQFFGGLVHRAAHGLEDVWRKFQAQRPDAQVEDLALWAHADATAFVVGELQKLTGCVSVHCDKSYLCWVGKRISAAMSGAPGDVIVAKGVRRRWRTASAHSGCSQVE